MGSSSNFWNILGIFGAVIEGQRTKNAIKKIQKQNEKNKGIVNYYPSPIEPFFEETELIGNMAISGGENKYRCRSISRAVHCALIQNYSAVILHISNQMLEQKINNYFDPIHVETINPSNPIYDPILGLTNAEISRLILSSSMKGCEIQGQGKYYLDGISDFIRAKKIQPYIDMYIKCPHLILIDKVNEAEATGRISNNTAKLIISQIMQGEMERGNIENFFSRLSNQSQSILAKKSNLSHATNISKTTGNNRIFQIDVLSNSNNLLINVLSNEIENILSQGKKIFLVLDNFQIQSNEMLQTLEKQSGGNFSMLLSSDDAYSSFGGDDNLFYSFIGKCSKVVIQKHASAYSCQKWADVIGSYEKQEINGSFSQNANYVGFLGMGSTRTASVNIKRENIIKPEEINRMVNDDVLILSRSNGELAHTKIV